MKCSLIARFFQGFRNWIKLWFSNFSKLILRQQSQKIWQKQKRNQLNNLKLQASPQKQVR